MAISRFRAFNTPGATPQLKDLLQLVKLDVMATMNCHAIGVVQKFNSANQTVTVSVAYKKIIYKPNAKGEYIETAVSYPLLLDCPVVILSGGDNYLTFPIEAGDECVVLFNDKDIDVWWAGSKANPVNSNRMHSLADAMALIGVRSKSTALSGYDTDRAVLGKTDGAKVAVGDKVAIANSSADLKSILEGILGVLSDIVPGTSLSAPAKAALLVQIGSLGGNVGGLLDDG